MGCGASNPMGDDYLDIDEVLKTDEYLVSGNMMFKLEFKDGNLVVTKGSDVWWESGTGGQGATHAMLKKDGDFAIFKDSAEIWSLGSAGCGATQLWLENDGNVLLYKDDDAKCSVYEEWLKVGESIDKDDWLWSNNAKFKLSIASTGNLVLEDATGKTIWQTNTTGADSLDMEKDGDLVLYKGETSVWSSGTAGSGAVEAWLEDDGELVLWDNNNNRVWGSKDAAKPAPAPAAAAAPAPAPANDVVEPWLDVNEKLEAGDWVWSPNKEFKLLLREDGNLVVLHKDKEVWWESKTAGNAVTHLVLDSNLDLVVYNGGSKVWSLGSAGQGGNKLWVEDNGFVGLYDGDTCKVGLYEEWLKAGEHLDKGDWLWSNNGEYTLTLEEGGNLVLAHYTGKELWRVNAAGADSLDMQADGNLVIYNGDKPLWASNTNGSGAVEMWLEDDGKVVLWDNNDKKVWDHETKPEVVEPWLDVNEKLEAGDWVWSPNKEFKLLLREDGNLVVLHKDKEVWWESKTAGNAVTHLVLDSNLDLVVYNGGSKVWSLGSAGQGGNKLWVEDNGFVGLYDGDTCKVGLYEEWLKAGEHLDKGDWLWSNNGEWQLMLEEGGNLVIKYYTGEVHWQSNTSGADSLDMQKDGNLVLYKGDNPLWASNTEGRGATEAWLEDNGKVVLWDNNDAQVWSSP